MPSTTNLKVVDQLTPFQIESHTLENAWHSVAVVPAIRNTLPAAAPGGSTRPARYAVQKPTTRQNTNHWPSALPRFTPSGPRTMIVPIGPRLNLACISGVPYSFIEPAHGNMYWPGGT